MACRLQVMIVFHITLITIGIVFNSLRHFTTQMMQTSFKVIFMSFSIGFRNKGIIEERQGELPCYRPHWAPFGQSGNPVVPQTIIN